VKVFSVVGARPQFVKLAPVVGAFSGTEHEHVIVHTGQHYDIQMSGVFFTDLKIPDPHVHLRVGSGSHGVQTGAMLSALDTVFEEHMPDWVLVYGDTNSTIAGALSAAKMHVPIAHIEAGLRSFNRYMPEEHNRVLTDHAADLLFAPTKIAMDNLAREGLTERSVLVGDITVDVLYSVRNAVADKPPTLPEEVSPEEGYLVCTIHRAENTDNPDRLGTILTTLSRLPLPVILPTHPRLAARAQAFGIPLSTGALRSVRPLSYLDMLSTVVHSRGVVTDSGGLQKETFLLGKACTTLRTETEWIETLVNSWNVLCPDLDKLAEIALRPTPALTQDSPYGDGTAAKLIVEVLTERARSWPSGASTAYGEADLR